MLGLPFFRAKGTVRILLVAGPLNTSVLYFFITHSTQLPEQGEAPLPPALISVWDFTEVCPWNPGIWTPRPVGIRTGELATKPAGTEQRSRTT